MTVRETFAAILAVQSHREPLERLGASTDAILKALSDLELHADEGIQTTELAAALAVTLRELWSGRAEDRNVGALVLDALSKTQALASRIGDDSNLALDPDLDSYYVQNIIINKLPTFLGRLSELQDFLEASVAGGLPSIAREARLPILVSQLRSTADELKGNLEAAYRGNPDGSLKRAIEPELAAMISSMNSDLAVLSASITAVDPRGRVAYNRFHVGTLNSAIKAWTVAQSELNRLLQQRIDNLLGKMRLGLALIGAFVGLSIFIAILTHRHIVRPLERLEAVASTVRETKDYSLRAEYSSQDEIGRVTAAFNDMLSELAAARQRETAERAEFARVTRLTTMGEMAASIAHEVNQPLAAIVASGNAGLRWLANATPDLNKVHAVLQRVVRDGLRAGEVIESVRALFRKDLQERAQLNVNELVREALALLHSELQSEQISVQVQLSNGFLSVLADRVQLQQVLLNLVTNAIDAMRPVQDMPRLLQVRTGVDEANGVLIAVEDSGSGIDPKDMNRIFDPFFTTKSSGMGLGLSICRSIIEAHGGRVWVSSGTPHGTAFHFMLPAYEVGGV